MLDGIPIADIGAKGLVAITVLLVILGKLVSSRRVDEVRADAQKRIDEVRADKDAQITEVRADKDAQIIMWRAVAETSQAQMAELLEHSRLTVQLLQSIEARAKASRE